MSPPTVVVLTPDDGLRSALHRLLTREGFRVRAGSGDPVAAGLDGEVTGVLVDARLLDSTAGPDLPTVRATYPSAPVLVMAARSDHPALVAAVRQGALPLTADFDVRVLLDTLGGSDGLAGVREPRRPLPPWGAAGVALPLPVD